MRGLPTSRWTLAFLIALLASLPAKLTAGDLKPEDILSRHIQSLGSDQARAAAKSRAIEGVAIYKILVGGSGQLQGKAVFASEGQKTHLLLKVPTSQYHGEQFICNGEHTDVAATYADKTYSDLGDFLKGQDAPLREGLLSGVLTTAWPLLDLKSRSAKLEYEGLKNIDGHQLQVLRYQPRKFSDLTIHLYFDPDNFHHVMTIYTASLAPRIGRRDIESPRHVESRYRIEERFSDFQTLDGLTLPSHYDLRFTSELENGFTKSVEWTVTTTRVLNNISLDPRSFQVK